MSRDTSSSRCHIDDLTSLLNSDVLQLIKINKMKSVPIDHVENNSSVPSCNICEDFHYIKNQRDLLKRQLDVKSTENTELQRRIIELENCAPIQPVKGMKELQERMSTQADTYNDILSKFQEQIDEVTKKREKAARDFTESENKLNAVNGENIKLLKRITILQEIATRDSARIIPVSNDTDLVSKNICKYLSFVKQVKTIFGFPDNDDDGRSDFEKGQLDIILCDLKTFLELVDKHYNELIKNRQILREIYEISATTKEIGSAARDDCLPVQQIINSASKLSVNSSCAPVDLEEKVAAPPKHPATPLPSRFNNIQNPKM